ncbi:MAG: YdeI/OmpD-associated family protein [Acidobacteriia bacterium]|nr:YdeI/OmpD-associated family protein [Terriglobia bacterium]
MLFKTLKTLDVRSCEEWRKWLAEHHDLESEVWLVFHKRETGQPSIAYDDAVDEALCFGWIDSLIKRLDEGRYARKFTPRKPDSRWSTANRKRYAQLKASGRLMPAGLNRAPTDRSGDAPRPSPSMVPQYIQEALRRHPTAWNYFEGLAPSYRRMYIAWIDSAKQQETKMRRLQEAIGLLAAGKKLGLK